MELTPRKIFKSTQDWYSFISEQKGKDLKIEEINSLRKATYTDIERLRKRPLLVYATNFLNGIPKEAPINITNDDVDGFTDLVNSIGKEHRSVDVLLHSPGGSPDATERIVHILRKRFDEVHFLIPHSAYSAATMLALSGDSIGMHSSATLGPIDPQIDGIPARSIRRGFDKVKKKIKEEGPESLPAYIPLIEKYSIHLLEICEDSEKLSKALVSRWLKDYMFKGQSGVNRKIGKAVKYFSNYDEHMLHSRPIFIEKISSLGLNIVTLDEELQTLIWEAYILLNGFFTITPFVKLYESNTGISWGKQFQPLIINPQNLQQPPKSQI